MKQRGVSPARRSVQGEPAGVMSNGRTNVATTRPATAWSGSAYTGFSSLPGGFAVHGQSVKQTQARATPLDSSIRSRKTPQPANSYSKVSQDMSENVAFKHSSSLDPSYKYVGALRAVPRSNSMPAQQSAARAQSAASRIRPASRSASRGRHEAPPAEPVPAKSSFKNLLFRQSKSGDTLIVSRTLTARMAAPHTLQLDHLKLSSCCLIEGEEQVTMLSYQHNNIQAISRLEQLPQLTILDMYSNNIQSLHGLPRMPALRGLMLGRNFISSIDCHQALGSLEVLDLHSNLLESLTGVSALTNLKRLNLAGNRISQLCGLSMLGCLEDLNLSRNFIVSLKVQEVSSCPESADDTKAASLPNSLRKLNLAANRLASLDDLEPLQQLIKLTQLGIEGNACCNLHPVSRFRIEVLARHSANLQQIDSHKVTPEERSLAAAMRWQDELASRGSLPAPERALTPLLSLANFNSCPLLQRSDSKLLSAAAAAAQARATVPTSSPSLAEDIKALDPAEETTQCEQVGTTYHECRGTPLKIIQTDISPSVKAKVSPQMATTHLHASSQNSPGTVEAGSGNTQPQSDPEVAQLARLPSAKGHCLSSYPSARPPSPMKHPSARGAPLNGVHASKMLSVKPLGVQPQRPSTAAAILNAAAAAVQAVAGHDGPAEMCGSADSCANLVLVQSEDRQPAVLKHCSQPDSRPLAGPTAGQTPQSAADDIGDSPQRPTTAFSLDSELQPARRVPSEQHAIPERLLTNKHAAALLSGIPAHLRVARAQHRESFLHLAEPGPEGEPGDTEGAGELLCVGQGQQPAQGLPSLCPPAEDVNDIQAAGSQPAQQPGASAELVDGYQLHIIGDAIDAVQSPVCASAQELILKGVHWDRVLWGMPLLVVLPCLRKLVLTDNHLTNLHQIDTLSSLGRLEELTIRHNPILRQVLLRPYICFCLPKLKALNGHDVKAEEVVKAQEMFQALHEARVTASKQQLNELARELHSNTDGLKKAPEEPEHDELTPAEKDRPSQQETVQHAAEAVWSMMVHKVVQREARSKKFDAVWPQVVKSLILKGFSGVY